MRITSLGLLLLLSCATTDSPPTSERCESDARANYQQCVNPNFVPEGEPLQVRTSQDSQACRLAYQQALANCAPRQEIPLVPIGTESSTRAAP